MQLLYTKETTPINENRQAHIDILNQRISRLTNTRDMLYKQSEEIVQDTREAKRLDSIRYKLEKLYEGHGYSDKEIIQKIISNHQEQYQMWKNTISIRIDSELPISKEDIHSYNNSLADYVYVLSNFVTEANKQVL